MKFSQKKKKERIQRNFSKFSGNSKLASFPSMKPAANQIAQFNHVFCTKQEERWEQAINL